MIRRLAYVIIACTFAAPAFALDDDHYRTADAAIERGIEFLRASQNQDGSWMPEPGPAVTAMIVQAMIDRPSIDADDPAVRKALDYILSMCKPDGGIYNEGLANYNTAICLSALAHVGSDERVTAAIVKARKFLGDLQWQNQNDPAGVAITPEHPFYGGAGYGHHGRPDLSNTQTMVQGLHDSGLSSDDPVFQRALVFITRCQGTEANAMFSNRIVADGGLIYATSVSKEQIGVPQSSAGEQIIEHEGQPVSLLRTYGSMTYAGFKSYLYANLKRNDPRVRDAYNWIRNNYTLDLNPGMPEEQKMQGHFYYLLTFSRAMRAWAVTTIQTPDGQQHDWANDVIDKLVSLQAADGSWRNDADRWMEGNPDLVTAYCLLALIDATK